MTLNIQVRMDNDAFFIRGNDEAQRIIVAALDALPSQVEIARENGYSKLLLDINGNNCGNLIVTV